MTGAFERRELQYGTCWSPGPGLQQVWARRLCFIAVFLAFSVFLTSPRLWGQEPPATPPPFMDPSIPLTLTVNGHPLGMSEETIKAGDVLTITFNTSGLVADTDGEVWFYGIQPDPASVVVSNGMSCRFWTTALVPMS